ncbi:hypothetical protein [Sphingobacterium psychroaquaticum]|uniref:Uncharacterized protein n=1 Tax=Sphingobacterium psychroaquaticum TaxID=561061 RepID=A0A1X7K4Z0_9SPHI|nr:hypothetical protein [Sphingobacterium psychroaquaticum]SMG35764.1 hypothetical protein SAMN05660862_2544 [Sphingobacterium psychroaquaticum]
MARNYAQFFAICKAVGRDKEDVVLEFTGGRTDSLSKLDDGEWKELMLQVRKWQPTKRPSDIPEGDSQRKKLIALAGKMHWGANTLEIIGRLNVWCQNQYQQELNQLDVAKLNKAVWVMENKIYKEYLKKI